MRTLLLFLVTAAACSANKPARPPASSSQCNGQLTYVVDNRTNVDVDVIASVGNSTQAIGTVRAGGNQEFMLPKGSLRAYFEYNREGGTARVRGRVDTRYSCRP